MLGPSHVRLIIQVFSKIWYAMCGLGILFCLVLFLCGLAALLDLTPIGIQFEPDAGPLFLVGSIVGIFFLVASIFVARSVLRFVLTQLEEIEKPQQPSRDTNEL